MEFKAFYIAKKHCFIQLINKHIKLNMTHFLPTVNQRNKQLNDKERESGPMVMPQEGLAPSLGSHFPTEGSL